MDEYLRMFGMRNWWMVERDRDGGKSLLESQDSVTTCGANDVFLPVF